MDRFRRALEQSSPFVPLSFIRDPSSAFSKPILPASSSLVTPKPLFGSPPLSNAVTAVAPDPETGYRQCLRNHAAGFGGHALDGCGEFVPASPADPLKCDACGCHRSFHRREQPQPDTTTPEPRHLSLLLPVKLTGCGGTATDQSSSGEERHNNHNSQNKELDDNSNNICPHDGSKAKRFRTKFSMEQKEKMRAFADRIGWRVQKKGEEEMERFCREVGVKRQVLKVWMHNNKHLNSSKLDKKLYLRG